MDEEDGGREEDIIGYEYETGDLDMSWADTFTEEDAKFADFYEENVLFVQLRILYVDKDSEIIKTKQEIIHLASPNYVSREELLYIIKTNRTHDDKYYGMLSIAKFNIDLSPSDLTSFLKSPRKRMGDVYLTPLNEVDSITFNKTISILQALNELLVVFYDVKPISKLNTRITKRIRFTPNLCKKTLKNNNIKA